MSSFKNKTNDIDEFRSALTTIQAHERTRILPVDHAVFFEALDKPPAPTDALRAAARQKRGRTASG